MKNKKISLSSICLIARSEFIKLILNPRIVILIVLYLIIKDMIVSPVIKAADQMSQPLNFTEIPIAVANSGFGILLIVLVYLMLMSLFPSVDNNIQFYITRMGRLNWILGEVLFQFVSGILYVGVIILVGIVQGASRSFVLNGWSLVVAKYDIIYEQMGEVKMYNYIPENLYNQITPYKALIYSYLLLFMFIILCNMFFLLGCMYGKKIMFFFIQAANISAGFGVLIAYEENWLAWLFPINHAILSTHYHEIYRRYIFSPQESIIMFSIVNLVMFILILRKSRTVSLDMIGGTVL